MFYLSPSLPSSSPPIPSPHTPLYFLAVPHPAVRLFHCIFLLPVLLNTVGPSLYPFYRSFFCYCPFYTIPSFPILFFFLFLLSFSALLIHASFPFPPTIIDLPLLPFLFVAISFSPLVTHPLLPVPPSQPLNATVTPTFQHVTPPHTLLPVTWCCIMTPLATARPRPDCSFAREFAAYNTGIATGKEKHFKSSPPPSPFPPPPLHPSSPCSFPLSVFC